ncbi:MAG: spore germination protein [Betaproteobacteria bacterium]
MNALGHARRILRRLARLLAPRRGTPSAARERVQPNTPVYPSIDENLTAVKKALEPAADLILRKVGSGKASFGIAMIDGLISRDGVDRDVVKALIDGFAAASHGATGVPIGAAAKRLAEASITTMSLQKAASIDEAIASILDGQVAVFGEGWNMALVASAQQWRMRAVSEPDVESVVRGPREGFTEDLRTNTSLLRRRLRTPRLRMEEVHIGRVSPTKMTIVYIHGLAPEHLLETIRSRLSGIDVDTIIESGHLEELIEDSPLSIFPTVGHTERPDLVAMRLLGGSAAILIDGTPFALLVPMTFPLLLHSSEDYYSRWPVVAGIRVFRWLSLIIAVVAPAFYVVLTSYHQELIPTALAVAIAQQRERVPYPAIVEALVMIFAFEIMVEAGVRLPRPIGSAVTIVGALVIGEAAVRAGLVSEAMVITIALTALATFVLPSYDLALVARMVRLPLTVVAGTLGLFGILASFLAILIHISTLKSFGVPFVSGLAPFVPSDQLDQVFRAPWWAMSLRPRLIGYKNPHRMEPRLDLPRVAARWQQQATTERVLEESAPGPARTKARLQIHGKMPRRLRGLAVAVGAGLGGGGDNGKGREGEDAQGAAGAPVNRLW